MLCIHLCWLLPVLMLFGGRVETFVDSWERGRNGSGMGVWLWSGVTEIVSHDWGSLLYGKKCMLVLGFFCWSLSLCALNIGQLQSQEVRPSLLQLTHLYCSGLSTTHAKVQWSLLPQVLHVVMIWIFTYTFYPLSPIFPFISTIFPIALAILFTFLSMYLSFDSLFPIS